MVYHSYKVREMSAGNEADLFGLGTLGKSWCSGMELEGTAFAEALEYMTANEPARPRRSMTEALLLLEQH